MEYLFLKGLPFTEIDWWPNLGWWILPQTRLEAIQQPPKRTSNVLVYATGLTFEHRSCLRSPQPNFTSISIPSIIIIKNHSNPGHICAARYRHSVLVFFLALSVGLAWYLSVTHGHLDRSLAVILGFPGHRQLAWGNFLLHDILSSHYPSVSAVDKATASGSIMHFLFQPRPSRPLSRLLFFTIPSKNNQNIRK